MGGWPAGQHKGLSTAGNRVRKQRRIVHIKAGGWAKSRKWMELVLSAVVFV